MLNRREALKDGAIGAVFGFLFRGRLGDVLQEEPIEPEQKPSAATVRVVPQKAFKPERLVIKGTVIGKELVPVTRFEPCALCADLDEDDEASWDCKACGGVGGSSVETDEMEEQDILRVPWTIEDIAIGNQTQFAAGGEIPGDMFAVNAPDSFVSLDACGADTEIRFRVRYTGDEPEGEIFQAVLIGTSINERGLPSKAMLPISSGVQIVG